MQDTCRRSTLFLIIMGCTMTNIGFDYYHDEAPTIRYVEPYQTIRDMVQDFHKAAGQYVGSIDTYPSDDVLAMRERLIDEERIELLKELCDLAYVVLGEDVEWGDTKGKAKLATFRLIAQALDMDFMGAFQAVHENNMGRMYQDDGTILRREDGKIIKNPNFAKVDLRAYI